MHCFSDPKHQRSHKPLRTSRLPEYPCSGPAACSSSLPWKACAPISSRHSLIGVDDLAAGGKPHALVLLHVGDGALQIFDAQRLAGDHRMQGKAQHPWLLAAVGVERVELIDHRGEILLAGPVPTQ